MSHNWSAERSLTSEMGAGCGRRIRHEVLQTHFLNVEQCNEHLGPEKFLRMRSIVLIAAQIAVAAMM